MNVIATATDKDKDADKRHPKKGVRSTLSEARTAGERYTPYNSINELRDRLKLINANVPAVRPTFKLQLS